MDNVWIYGTNIYLLYEDIAKEYGADWAEEEMDIDLPFVISKKLAPSDLRYKADFTERKIPVSLQPGSKYKELVGKESKIGKIVEFPYRIDDLMNEHFGITNTETRQKCCEDILNFSDVDHIEEKLQEILQKAITDERQKTLKYQLKDWINKLGYANSGQTYWQYVRNLFVEILYHNICKANRIQNNIYDIELGQYKQCFESLDLGEILNVQNAFSKTSNGFIWVLNTCVFVVADYNFSLVQRY
jgi:hypothetical protein